MSRYWARRARIGFVVHFMAGLPAPAGDIPMEGCPETQLVGFANYCRSKRDSFATQNIQPARPSN